MNPPKHPTETNYISLSGNNFDDFGSETTLNAFLCLGGNPTPLGVFTIKVLIENHNCTATKLDELCENGWDGIFPIKEVNYISLPSDIDFYKLLLSHLGLDKAVAVLDTLKDAGYFKNVLKADRSEKLIDLPAFSNSLLRSSGSNKAYQDGWRLFIGEESHIRDFQLNISTQDWQTRTVPFRFESDLLPYDINVLIGPNGIGKSYCLKSLTEYWLKIGMGDQNSLEQLGHTPFDTRPNINKLILISYSPFEEFSLGLTGEDNALNNSAYRYFGFRQEREDGTIGISRNLPKLDASNSLIDAIYEDEKYQQESWWVNKFNTVESALKGAFDFDSLAIKVDMKQASGALKHFPSIIGSDNYFTLNASLAEKYDLNLLKNICQLSDGIQFIKDGKVKPLSSGQRLFTYIVINVVGSIREHSLIVIDEPELFLHPTLEIDFVSLLKAVLKPFKSKAILATHSLAVVREVPSNCVHIFRDQGLGLDIVPPPFETFGGDMQRISSYVFGDKSVTKPYEDFLVKLSEKYTSEQLINLLGDEINEEMTMALLRLGKVR